MMETENYIEEYIELNDFLVSECEGYSGKVPGIKNVSLKNNGDKKITALSLKLEFLNAEGNVAETKKGHCHRHYGQSDKTRLFLENGIR